MKPRTKLIVIIAAVAVIVVIALITIIRSRQQALLTVTSSDPQALITVGSRSGQKLNVSTGQGRYSQKVPVGDYVIKGETKTGAVQKTVSVKPGPETAVSLTFIKPLPLEMVTSASAASMVADAGTLEFIDTKTSYLTRLTAQNQIIPINNYNFSNIKWADPSYGLGLSTMGQFYLIQNSTPTLLNLPFTSSSHSTAAVAPNKDIYFSNGTQVYLYADGKFTKIYETKKAVTVLAANNTSVVGIEDPAATTGQKADEGNVILLSRSGSAKRTKGESYDSSWSPSGDKVIVNGDEETALLDQNLGRLIYFPHSNLNSPVWLDNDTVAYGIGSTIWRFDTATGTSQQLATDPSVTFTQLYAPKDGSYLYVGTQNYKDGKNQAVRRIPLKGQSITPVATILGLILPSTTNGCQMSYVNFTAPTVSVSGPKAQQAACTAAAQKYLQTYRVDTRAIGLSFSAL